MAVAGLGPKRKQQKKESLRQRLSTSPKASPPTVFAFNNPLPSQSSLPPEMAFLQQLELLCFTASQGDFYWPSTISARAKTMVPATTYTMLQKITPTCHTVYFPSCMGHPNPPKSFTFCYILSAHLEMQSLQRPAETESLLWTKSAVCIKAVTSLPQAWLEGSYRGTNKSQCLSPTFNLGPVTGMANTRTNCTYLCNRDTPVEWQGLSAVTSHGPPTDSREGKAIYVRSSCCCPQQVSRLSKRLFQDKNSTWIPLAYDAYLAYCQVQSAFYTPPLSIWHAFT